ncbi:uncharacterized protein LY89DRAFT_730403 [Mollisia scopiformis]|uniref:Uncharacterized protein n=1 Tax=Mollisia scopiformis TaxID=149040 RepID=A0A194XJQ4_MOLSC|nr:uncharacterized protein LY89DRAFT_730403 [Mollisia scopiformis]KUJ20356.1 hypothetical protein LY89DRAFT_730403 [Mollisia scopiformis]
MTSNDEAQTPDLATILRTLAALSPPNQTQQPQQAQPQFQAKPQAEVPPYQPTIQNHQPPAQPWPRQQHPQISRSTTPPGSPKNHVDPTTIIDWKEGLHCVTDVLSKNKIIIVQEVQRMIKVQNEHELQWFKGREALIEKQKARKEGQKQIDEALKAVGGTVMAGESNTTPEELARELVTFDMKVYKAQTEMTREMSSRLRSLGIPFFGTRSDLVRPTTKAEAATSTTSTKEGKLTIDELELVRLQRKMLNHLEEYC